MRVDWMTVSRRLTLLSLPLLLAGAVEGDGDLLPDLVVDGAALSETRIDYSTLPGRRLLRLTTSTPNIGAGALEVRGSTIVAPDAQEVLQRIYRADGSYWDRLAGTFEYHPTHGHTHFDGWAVYRLRERSAEGAVGAILAQGDKTSFCLLDIVTYGEDAAAAGAPHYTTCGQMVQGISPGWSDVYDLELDDQWIDITDIPDGSYWLEAEVDPEGQVLEEADGEANNVTRVAIELSGDSVAFPQPPPQPPPDLPGPGVAGDPLNNQPPALSVLQPGAPVTWVEQAYEGLTVQWTASDPDADPVSISLWVDRDGVPGPETVPLGGYQGLPAAAGYAVINTAALDTGTWYLLVEATDGGAAASVWAAGNLVVYHKGDLDADGHVDRADWVQLVQRRRALRDQPPSALAAGWEALLDLDRNGAVDELDIDLFRSHALSHSAHHD